MKTIAIFYNKLNEQASCTALSLQQWLSDNQYKYILEDIKTTKTKRIKKADFIISLGGDGTTLRAARLASEHDIPILGVFLGTLGFLAEIDTDKLYEAINQMAIGDYHIDERSMLELNIHTDSKDSQKAMALNEIVLTATRKHMLSLDVLISDKYVTTYTADGLIISTPTGSTAYNLSAGGPILSPKLDATTITPICAHSLNLRSLVVDGEEEVTIRNTHPSEAKPSYVALDGQKEINLSGNSIIRIKKSKETVKFIRFHDFCFFEALRSKLKWSGKSH
jgi:NAD+ kinase